MTTDACKCCGSTDLFSGWFDEDGLAVPLAMGAPTPAGVAWRTYCNECGELWAPRRKRKGAQA